MILKVVVCSEFFDKQYFQCHTVGIKWYYIYFGIIKTQIGNTNFVRYFILVDGAKSDSTCRDLQPLGIRFEYDLYAYLCINFIIRSEYM